MAEVASPHESSRRPRALHILGMKQEREEQQARDGTADEDLVDGHLVQCADSWPRAPPPGEGDPLGVTPAGAFIT